MHPLQDPAKATLIVCDTKVLRANWTRNESITLKQGLCYVDDTCFAQLKKYTSGNQFYLSFEMGILKVNFLYGK